MGPPDSGKTILAAQMAFATARADGRVLILTVMSESSDQLIRHLRGVRFFDESLLGAQVQVLSLTSFMAQGLEAAADAIAAEALQRRADQTARAFLYAVGTRVGVLGAPVVIIEHHGLSCHETLSSPGIWQSGPSEPQWHDTRRQPWATSASISLLYVQHSTSAHTPLVRCLKPLFKRGASGPWPRR